MTARRAYPLLQLRPRLAVACLLILTGTVPPATGQSANPPVPSQQPADGPANATMNGGMADAGPLSQPPDGTAADRARADMRRIVLRLEAEIAELARLRQWQGQLLEAARINPGDAARQRRPVAACRRSVLAPWCDDLDGMFAGGGAEP